MHRFAFSLFALSLFVAAFAHADEWSKTYTISGNPDLRVQTSDANLNVDTWDKNIIDVHVTTNRYKIGDGGIIISEHQNGDVVDIDVRYPHHGITINFGGLNKYTVDVTIHMPREGHVKLHTGDGAITLANLKGAMELESGDGREEINSVDGNLQAHTSDGRISATGRFDGLELHTGDGRIEARALPGSVVNSDWSIRSGDGSVTLQLPDNFAADVDLRTGDGHIELGIPVMVQGKLGDRNVHGKLNGGGNLLTVQTGDGSILVNKS